MGAGPDGFAAHASASMPTNSPPQHGEHPGTSGQEHSGACAFVACASAITATSDHGPESMGEVIGQHVAYLGGMMPPDGETAPPPPRLG